MIILLFLSTFITALNAALQSCEDLESEESVDNVCTLEYFKPYEVPFGVVLTTKLNLLDIHQINADEKSISLYIELLSFWKDEISRSKNPR